jgi:hypothetical protein
MALRRKITRAVAALTAGALTFVFGAGIAHADIYAQERTFRYSFTTADGTPVTCRISAYTEIERSEDSGPFRGSASIGVFPINLDGPPDACAAHIWLAVTFHDSSGTEESSGASGDGAVDWYSGDVGFGLSVEYIVLLYHCYASPTSTCTVSFKMAPK